MAVAWSCFPFIRSGQNHLAGHSERGKKTRHTVEEVGRKHQGIDRPGVGQVPEGSGELGKMEKTGCKIICGAPTTLAVKALMMMMMCEILREAGQHWSDQHCCPSLWNQFKVIPEVMGMIVPLSSKCHTAANAVGTKAHRSEAHQTKARWT